MNNVKNGWQKWNHTISFFQTKHHLETLIDELNAGRPQCPVGLNTLVIPRKLTLSMSDETVNEKQQPYVYLNCGHVQGHHDWGQDKDSKDRRCPMCLEVLQSLKI
jgi:pellino protein